MRDCGQKSVKAVRGKKRNYGGGRVGFTQRIRRFCDAYMRTKSLIGLENDRYLSFKTTTKSAKFRTREDRDLEAYISAVFLWVKGLSTNAIHSQLHLVVVFYETSNTMSCSVKEICSRSRKRSWWETTWSSCCFHDRYKQGARIAAVESLIDVCW